MKKCTDRKGVTILMALLLLLVASMVSVVILTAATTAARHLSHRQLRCGAAAGRYPLLQL